MKNVDIAREELSANSASVAGNSISSFEEMPDEMANDAMASCSNVMQSFESSLAENGNMDALQDAMLLKQASLQKDQSKDLKHVSKTLNDKKPGNNPDYKTTKNEVSKLLAECLPCLDRPEIVGGLKFAIDLAMTMFRDLTKRFSILKNMILLRLPSSTYDDICPIIQALTAMCIPDIVRLIALMEFYIKSLFRKVSTNLQFSSDFLSSLILAPFIIAFETLIIQILDALLKPIECIVGAVGVQAKKLPGAAAKYQEFIEGKKKDYTGILFLLKKLTNARNELRTSFNNAQNDFNAALCSVNMQCDQVIELLREIKDSFALLGLIKTMKTILTGRSKEICGITSYEDPLGYYYGVISNSVNFNNNNNGDNNVNNNIIIQDDNIIIFDDPPVIFNNDDLAVISDIIDTGNSITKDDIIEATRNIYGDQDPVLPYTNGELYSNSISNDIQEITLLLNANKNYTDVGDIDKKNNNSSLYPSLSRIPEELDGKMVSAIISLKECLNKEQ